MSKAAFHVVPSDGIEDAPVASPRGVATEAGSADSRNGTSVQSDAGSDGRGKPLSQKEWAAVKSTSMALATALSVPGGCGQAGLSRALGGRVSPKMVSRWCDPTDSAAMPTRFIPLIPPTSRSAYLAALASSDERNHEAAPHTPIEVLQCEAAAGGSESHRAFVEGWADRVWEPAELRRLVDTNTNASKQHARIAEKAKRMLQEQGR